MRFKSCRRREIERLSEAVEALTAELQKQREMVRACGETTALDMLSGVLSGRIGAKVSQHQAARSFGSVSRA